VHVFTLAISIAGEHVSAKEAPGHHQLPQFCPDRHINPNQSFCLGWGDGKPGHIIDEAAARQWWSTVYRFLAHQISANVRRVFPGAENGRAHGDAAKHQAIAEQAAECLGPEFKAAAQAGLFEVRQDVRPGKRRLELWRGARFTSQQFPDFRKAGLPLRLPTEAHDSGMRGPRRSSGDLCPGAAPLRASRQGLP